MTVGVVFWTYESRILHYETRRNKHSGKMPTVHKIKARRNNLRSNDMFLDELENSICIIEGQEELCCDWYGDEIFRRIIRQIIEKGEDNDHCKNVKHRIVTQITFEPLVKPVPNTWPEQISEDIWKAEQDDLLNIVAETMEGIAMILYLQKYQTEPDEILIHHQSYTYSLDDRFRNAFRILRTLLKESV